MLLQFVRAYSDIYVQTINNEAQLPDLHIVHERQVYVIFSGLGIWKPWKNNKLQSQIHWPGILVVM